MSIQKIPVGGLTFSSENTTTLVPVAVGTTSVSGGLLVVSTSGSHGMIAGQQVTFATATPAGYGTTNFVVLSVPTASTFTISNGLALGLITAGNAVPILVPKPGFHRITTGANAKVQSNPGNDGWADTGFVLASTNTSTIPTDTIVAPVPYGLTGAVWRLDIAVSSNGWFFSDGFSAGLIFCSGSAGTTYWSNVK